MKVKKYYFPVVITGEGYSTGYILLTQEEANVVKKATTFSNWVGAELDKFSGRFIIETDKGIPEEWFHEHERLIREWEENVCNEAV